MGHVLWQVLWVQLGGAGRLRRTRSSALGLGGPPPLRPRGLPLCNAAGPSFWKVDSTPLSIFMLPWCEPAVSQWAVFTEQREALASAQISAQEGKGHA